MKHKAISYGAALVILLAVWHLGSLALQKPFLPTPLASMQAFGELWRHEDMGTHFLISAYRVIASILLAVVFAVPLGLIMGRSERDVYKRQAQIGLASQGVGAVKLEIVE